MRVPSDIRPVKKLEESFMDASTTLPNWLTDASTGDGQVSLRQTIDNGGYAVAETGTTSVGDQGKIQSVNNFNIEWTDLDGFRVKILVRSPMDPSLQYNQILLNGGGGDFFRLNMAQSTFESDGPSNITTGIRDLNPNIHSVDMRWYQKRDEFECLIDGIVSAQRSGVEIPDKTKNYTLDIRVETQDTGANRTLEIYNVGAGYFQDRRER